MLFSAQITLTVWRAVQSPISSALAISGISTAGINLAISNIGIKLASKDEAIVYFSARSVVVALISFTGPMIGGFLADFFSKRSLSWSVQWD